MIDFLKETKAALYDRVGDKFLRTLILIWTIENWHVVAAGFNALNSKSITEYEYYKDILLKVSIDSFYIPLAGTVFIILVYPWIKMAVVYYSETLDVKTINVKNVAKKVQLPTPKQVEELHKEIERAKHSNSKYFDLEQNIKKVKTSFVDYYKSLIGGIFKLHLGGENGSIEFVETHRYFKPGEVVCFVDEKIYDMATAEREELRIDTTTLGFVFASLGGAYLIAKNNAIFCMLTKEYADTFKLTENKPSEYIKQTGEFSKMQVILTKQQPNVFHIQFHKGN